MMMQGLRSCRSAGLLRQQLNRILCHSQRPSPVRPVSPLGHPFHDVRPLSHTFLAVRPFRTEPFCSLHLKPPAFHLGFVSVRHKNAYVVERLGKYLKTLDEGFHLLIPLVDRITFAYNLEDKPVFIQQQTAISQDNCILSFDGHFSVKVVDPFKASYRLSNPLFTIVWKTGNHMRHEMAKMSIEEIFKSRTILCQRTEETVNEAAKEWGLVCHRFELGTIVEHETVEESIMKQAATIAARELRRKLGESEAILAESQATANGITMMSEALSSEPSNLADSKGGVQSQEGANSLIFDSVKLPPPPITIGIVVVGSGFVYVVEELGAFAKILTAGKIHIINLATQRVAYCYSLRDHSISLNSMEVITKFFGRVWLDLVVYFKVVEPSLTAVKVDVPTFRVEQRAKSSVLRVAQEFTLEELMINRKVVCQKVMDLINEVAEGWGLKCLRVDLGRIDIRAWDDGKASKERESVNEAAKELGLVCLGFELGKIVFSEKVEASVRRLDRSVREWRSLLGETESILPESRATGEVQVSASEPRYLDVESPGLDWLQRAIRFYEVANLDSFGDYFWNQVLSFFAKRIVRCMFAPKRLKLRTFDSVQLKPPLIRGESVKVEEGVVYVVEELGVLVKSLTPGKHRIDLLTQYIPFAYSVQVHTFSLNNMYASTKHFERVWLDSTFSFKVVQPILTAYRVDDVTFCVTQRATSSLYDVAQQFTVQELLSKRDVVHQKIMDLINELVQVWGVECVAFEIKKIDVDGRHASGDQR
ncbi:OLC1v1020964C1 [Oldenlandia corymbosa var. corymbosa]|uniref:OLC1v1020964C1 n=1 Tax=Oldenlandia corymbosa var. corymbosa TaxID=529605 RepID=A0AAV1BUL5_OLDCO|nr:OLC1v1020964C1 [Oldenlandia corymbosa var. corymbosa]